MEKVTGKETVVFGEILQQPKDNVILQALERSLFTKNMKANENPWDFAFYQLFFFQSFMKPEESSDNEQYQRVKNVSGDVDSGFT